MFKKITDKLQTREGITLVASIALIIGIIAFVFGGFNYRNHAKGMNGQPAPSITVTGNGEVFVAPDVAKFTFTVEKDAKTMSDAQKSVTEQGNALIAQLKDAGIEEKDIKTEGFNAYPKYENQNTSSFMGSCVPGYCPPMNTKPVIVGYTVSHTYSVKVKNLEKSGDIAKLITDANISSLSGPDFTIDDQNKINNDARDKAITDAKEQAEILADQLDVHLGKIVDFQVINSGMIAPYAMRAMAGSDMVEKASAPTIEPGQTNVKIQVQITYQIR